MQLQSNEKATIVQLILNKQTEEAIELLAKMFGVKTPKLKVGLPKGHRKNVYGCYTNTTETINLLDSDIIGNPFVILHEFYHHLRSRSIDKQHRGTERNADKFAIEFLQEYEAEKRYALKDR